MTGSTAEPGDGSAVWSHGSARGSTANSSHHTYDNSKLRSPSTMQESLPDHIDNASEILREIERTIARLSVPKHATHTKEKVDSLSSLVKDGLTSLDQAANAAFKQQAYFALCPSTFNPFHLLDVERSYSHYSIDDPSRTLVAIKRVDDRDYDEEPLSAELRIGDRIVIYTISSMVTPHTESYVLHGSTALTSYQNDETEARTAPWATGPLVKNHGARRRLLAAKEPPPGGVDLDKVARLVVDSLKNMPDKSEVTTRVWFCIGTKYTMDIVSVFALMDARRRMLEVPGVGDKKDLVEEDTVSRYLGIDKMI